MLERFPLCLGSGTCRIQVRVLMDVFFLTERICGRMSVSKHLECSPSFPFPFPYIPPSLSFLLSSYHNIVSISIAFPLLSSSHPPSSNQNPKIINYKLQVTFRISSLSPPPQPSRSIVKVEGEKIQQKKRMGWCFCEWAQKGEGRELGWVWFGIGGWAFEEKGNARGSPQ